MKTSICITFLAVLISTFVYSQTDKDIIYLEKQKNKVEQEIQYLTDSISRIDLKIAELNSKKFLERIKDSSLTMIARKGGKLRKEPRIFADVIMILGEDKEVIVLDYKDGYYEICQGNICGHINEVWILKNDLITEFKNLKEADKKSINSKRTNSTSYSSALSNSKATNSTYKRKTYQSYRTYYRGPKGGCYYINSNGNKSYVDRSLCN